MRQRLGNEIVHLGSVPSTMDELDRRARAGAAEGLVVVADEQTAGRGRAGRTWASAAGSGLFCSVLLRPPSAPARLGALALLAGQAVAEAIERLAPCRCRLKWPNDVLIGEAKVAGILILARLDGTAVDYVNVGIGVNLTQGVGDLPPGGTSVRAACGVALERDAVLAVLLERLEAGYERFLAGDSNLSDWLERAHLLGEEVEVVQDGRVLLGRFVDVTADGGLVLEQPDGSRLEVVQGDLIRGPRPAG